MTIITERTKFIGGSDVGAIIGVSPWKNILDVWMDKTKPPSEDKSNVVAKKRGHRLEPYIIDMIRDEYEIDVITHNIRYIDREISYFACEIDFEYKDKETGKVENGEIKTVHPFKSKEWGKELTDELPLVYIAQAQHNMGVTKREKCKVFALIGDDLKQYELIRDNELIFEMREKCKNFWEKNVIPKIKPSIDYQQKNIIESLKKMYPGSDGTTIDATDMHKHWRAVYLTALEMRNKYDGIIDGSKAHMLSDMGNSSAIVFDDGKCFSRKIIKKKGYTAKIDPSEYIDFRFSNFKE